MPRCVNPVANDRLEFFRGVACVRRRHELEQSTLASGGHGLHVAVEDSLERLLLLPLWMLRRQGFDAIERERNLNVDRLLGPQRAVVVERGDPLGDLNEVGPALLSYFRDEVDDGLLGSGVIPGGQRIGVLRGNAASRRAGSDQTNPKRSDLDHLLAGTAGSRGAMSGASPNLRETIRETWSSEGPCVDSARGVPIFGPGVSIAQGERLFHLGEIRGGTLRCAV